MKFVSLFIAVFLSLLGTISAQQLQQPLEEVPFSNKCYVLLKTGDIVDGTILSTSGGRGINQVKLEDSNGIKHSLNAPEIQEFAVAMNGATRLQYTMERRSSVKKLLSRDQPTAKPNEFIVYRNTSINGEEELLLQLLNPDFDAIFEVFFDPFARTTTTLEGELIIWTGDKHRAYFISKNGSPLLKLKKGNYKQAFPILFGDCAQLDGIKKPKFKDLENHILHYQTYCAFD